MSIFILALALMASNLVSAGSKSVPYNVTVFGSPGCVIGDAGYNNMMESNGCDDGLPDVPVTGWGCEEMGTDDFPIQSILFNEDTGIWDVYVYDDENCQNIVGKCFGADTQLTGLTDNTRCCDPSGDGDPDYSNKGKYVAVLHRDGAAAPCTTEATD